MTAKVLDPRTASAAALRTAERNARLAAEAAEARERERAIVEAAAAARVRQEQHAANRARVQAMALPPEPAPLETKMGALEVKLTGIDEAGRTLEGWAAAWAVDDGGDQILPDAANAFLAKTEAVRDLPVYWCHRADEVPLGTVLSLTPDAHGLRVKVRIFNHQRGQEVLAAAREMLALGKKLGFSIGYWARDVAWRKIGNRTVREIRRLDLSEISLTPSGKQMNRAAVVDGIKTTVTVPKTQAENRAALAQRARELENEIFALEERQRETNDAHYNSLVGEAGAAERVRQRAKAREQTQRMVQAFHDGAVADHAAQEERRAMLARLAQFGLSLPGDRP